VELLTLDVTECTEVDGVSVCVAPDSMLDTLAFVPIAELASVTVLVLVDVTFELLLLLLLLLLFLFLLLLLLLL
jgi:hypothetical protein